MYKDKDKQREANAERQRRYKAKQKALLSEGVTQGVTGLKYLPDSGGFVVPDEMGPLKLKRGKDIKVFEDLPPDVQATIRRVSESNEEKQKRTAAAIKYQHLFPDSYHTTGLWLDDEGGP